MKTKTKKNPRFTENDMRVLHVLSRMGRTEDYKEKGYFSITNKKLREETGISSNSTLKNSLDRLEKYGLISRTPGDWGNPTHYVYHADTANNFTTEKKNKKSKSKGTRCERLTHPETQKLNDLQEIITKEVEAVCAPLVKQIEELNDILLKMRVGSHSEAEGSPSVAFFVSLRPLDGLVNQTDRNTKN